MFQKTDVWLPSARRQVPVYKADHYGWIRREGEQIRLNQRHWSLYRWAVAACLWQAGCIVSSLILHLYLCPECGVMKWWRSDFFCVFFTVVRRRLWPGSRTGVTRWVWCSDVSAVRKDPTDAADLVGWRRKTPAFIRAFMVEDMKVADGSNWFKGLTIITLSSFIPPLLRLNLIILTQKPFNHPPPTRTRTHAHTLNILLIGMTKEKLIFWLT